AAHLRRRNFAASAKLLRRAIRRRRLPRLGAGGRGGDLDHRTNGSAAQMIRKLLFAAIVALAACGQSNNSDSGVMAEIERGEKADAQAAQQANAGNEALLAQVR